MKKLLRQNGSEKMIGGVAAGIAEYLDIDPTFVRLFFAVGFFTPAPTVLAYLIMWIIVPAKPKYELSSGSVSY